MRVIAPAADLQALDDTLFPGILKTTQLGYDGKGQLAVASRAALAAAWDALQRVPCVLEKRLPLRHEISVIVARARRRRNGCTCRCSRTCTATASWR